MLDLAKARILVTNDDGVRAAGLKVLERIARSFTPDVWVVAPETEQSGASHSLTLRLPLRLRAAPGRRRYAVDGTPTDCVLLAIRELMRKKPPDLVLSGVNRGANMGEDVTYSGTVAAAMEGTLMEVPSVAISLSVSHVARPAWATAARWGAEVIRRVALEQWPRNTLLNVNIPNVEPDAVAGIRAVRQGRRKIGDNLVASIDPRGEPYYWIGPIRDEDASRPGTDLHAVSQNFVAVTPICLDMTHPIALAELHRVFA